ncbi:MAG: TMEM175 family protein [Polyangiaceae bacterium]
MGKGRLEAFSDGVLAIIITIMVLELKIPHHGDWHALADLAPVFCGYVLSFAYVGIYWNNHHHLVHTVKKVTAGVMWANLNLLFWLSLLPFATGWAGEHTGEALPAALYGVILLLAAIAYLILQTAIVRGGGGVLQRALGSDIKGKVSPLLYASGIGLAFVRPWISQILYAIVALIWILPDRRIEKELSEA